jgi:hypothetical protein
MVAKLKAFKAELQRRKHAHTVMVGAWLRIVVLAITNTTLCPATRLNRALGFSVFATSRVSRWK